MLIELHLRTAPLCAFWDEETDTWSSEGCELAGNDNDSATCVCDHLTNFGVILDVNGRLLDDVSVSIP